MHQRQLYNTFFKATMRRYFVYLFLVLLFRIPATAQNGFVGKCGAELKKHLHENFQPKTIVPSDNIWSVFRQCDINADGSVLDRYSSQHVPFPSDSISSPYNTTIDYVTDLSWWGTRINESIKTDLYNILPCNIDVPMHKCDYMPGEITDTIYSNGIWATGWGYIDEYRINLYVPPKGYEGDFARIIMYMATIHHAERWSGQGVNFFLDGAYPTLNGYSKSLLLKWHNQDTVSDIEILRNNIIETVQGNRNPFVDYPYLADYIWGEKSTQPYIPETPREKIPLRSTYSISTDKNIDLYSPYIPDDVNWTINGTIVETESIPTRQLGVGTHELRYESTKVKGKLKINITE